MPTTTELVAECIELCDGSASPNDDRLKKVWRSRLQVSSTLIWNDRFWEFKVVEDTVTINPEADVHPLPTDFGSFEALGAGVFLPNGKGRVDPAYMGEMTEWKHSSLPQTGDPKRFVLYYVGGVPYLRLFPNPAEAMDLACVFLRRAPKLQLDSIDPGADELYFIPEQWHELVRWGGEWQNKMKSANAMTSAEQEVWKAGLDEMRARSACIIRGIEPWRPGGRRR